MKLPRECSLYQRKYFFGKQGCFLVKSDFFGRKVFFLREKLYLCWNVCMAD